MNIIAIIRQTSADSQPKQDLAAVEAALRYKRQSGGFVTALDTLFFESYGFNSAIAINAHEGTACNFGKAAGIVTLIDAEPVAKADTLKFRRCRRPPVGRTKNRVLPLGCSSGFLVESLTGETKVTCY